MNKITLLILFLVTYLDNFSQVTYLNLTGLDNTNSISSVPIGATGTTFDASIINTGTQNSPKVTSNGNIDFRMNSLMSVQCINITFSNAAQLYITDNSAHTNSSYAENDSLIFNTSSFTITDPLNRFNVWSTSIVPKEAVKNYTTWNVVFAANTTFQVCAQRTSSSPGTNTKFPIRLGITTASVLPIELLNFDIEVLQNKVQLHWQTASEINNDYFTIERSKNGINWEEVATIDGAGNSYSILSYSTIDDDPYFGISYYRLKQTDFDGKFEYSLIRSVNIKQSENSQIEIFPNPTTTQVTINGSPNELEEVVIYNAQRQNVTSLTSKIMTSNNRLVIDMSKLNKGMYFIKSKTTANKVYKQ